MTSFFLINMEKTGMIRRLSSKGFSFMLKALKPILEIQKLDMQMIQLVHLKTRRLKELEQIQDTKLHLKGKLHEKERIIQEIKKEIRIGESSVLDVKSRLKKLEEQQSSIRKVDEFNALSQEMSQVERERTAKEHLLSDLYDKLALEEDQLGGLTKELELNSEGSKLVETEIYDSIDNINEEGRQIKLKRDELVSLADPEVFRIYERLLRNKKDSVVVPIENRCCSGCHIQITAQDENLVRKSERIVFCEHCSRIHYFPEVDFIEDEESTTATKRRRRKAAV
jgi:predicted  nucleic acid-binding Zn-ribbon protein